MKLELTLVSSIFIALLILIPTLTVTSAIIGKHEIFDEVESEYPFANEVTIYVDDNNTVGPWDGTIDHPFQYIQQGIDYAHEDDTVFVFNGTYFENITIDKPLNLEGEHIEKTIIDGMYSEIVVQIISTDTTLQNFSVRNSGGYSGNAGIESNSANNIIKNCIIYRTRIGICIDKAAFNAINNCTFFSNGIGLFLDSSEDTVIEGSTFYHNAIGVHIENSTSNLIKFCYLHTNGIAALLNATSSTVIHHCNVSDNSDNHGGVFLTECSNITISNSIFRHNGMGVNTENGEAIIVEASGFVLNTHFALLSKRSCNVVVSRCVIADNFRFGLYVEDSCFTAVENNIFNNELYGLYAEDSNCYARFNWWGSSLGPSRYDFRRSDRITWKPAHVKFVPWRLRSISGVGADWDSNEEYLEREFSVDFEKKIVFSGDDDDDDSVPNWWEEKYGYDPMVWDDHEHLDPDYDGLNNVEECYTDGYGSHPFQKDIFLEIDWMKPRKLLCSNKPPAHLIDRLITIFKRHDINLHVDLGCFDGGEEIPYKSCFSFADLVDLYWDHFLENDLDNLRKGIFHYGIICDYGPDLNFPFIGWDHLDSFLISAQWLKYELPSFTRGRLIVGAAVHQLGSSLGLLADTHGGNDNLDAVKPLTLQWFKFRNYKSCMNYYYKYKTFSYSNGRHGRGDFNDWDYLDLSFFKNSHFNWPKI